MYKSIAICSLLAWTTFANAATPLGQQEMSQTVGFACSCGDETNDCSNANDECVSCYELQVGPWTPPACSTSGWDYIGETIEGCHCGGSHADYYCPSGTQTCANKVACSTGTVKTDFKCNIDGTACVSGVAPWKCRPCLNGSALVPAQNQSVSNQDCLAGCP